MEYLQYLEQSLKNVIDSLNSFKPYYKWNTFNTPVFYAYSERVSIEF